MLPSCMKMEEEDWMLLHSQQLGRSKRPGSPRLELQSKLEIYIYMLWHDKDQTHCSSTMNSNLPSSKNRGKSLMTYQIMFFDFRELKSSLVIHDRLIYKAKENRAIRMDNFEISEETKPFNLKINWKRILLKQFKSMDSSLQSNCKFISSSSNTFEQESFQ